MTEIILGGGEDHTLEPQDRSELVRDLSLLVSGDLFDSIKKMVLVKPEQESVKILNTPVREEPFFSWLFYTEKHSWQKWFLKGKIVQRNVLRVIYGERRLVNGIYIVNKSESLKCELFMDSPSIRSAVQSILGPQADRLGLPDIEYIDRSNDLSARYPGERLEIPKARIVKK